MTDPVGFVDRRIADDQSTLPELTAFSRESGPARALLISNPQGERVMRQLSRRAVLAGATALAGSALSPIFAIQRALAQGGCLRSLKDFRTEASQSQNQLDAGQRDVIVEQAITLLRDFYVHLPLKEARYGVKPLERLAQFRKDAAQFNDDQPFHTGLLSIFAELHDLHTLYRPPSPYRPSHAFLPFRIEACSENGQAKYIVSKVVGSFSQPTFGKGVEVVSWNGVPIEDAADRAGPEAATASARRPLGLARLTYRALQLQPVPDTDTVTVHYRADGKEFDIEVPWQVVTLASGACSSCNETQQIPDFQAFLFTPYTLCSPFGSPQRFSTADGDFGYIRIFSFDRALVGDEKFVEMFKNQVAGFANNTRGLIVDVRDNGGGSTRAGERILQFIKQTPRDIEPSSLYFRATQASLDLCKLGATVKEVRDLGCKGMDPWVQSIQQAMAKNETFSDAFQYTCPDAANIDGRIYPGPVIVVTSARSYSSAEFFAAGFQDHGGMILGVDETTGGGGAGFRLLSDLNGYFSSGMQPLPFKPMPKDAGFQVAFRRSKRVGLGTGKEIEDAGIARDHAYAMTRNDLLNNNEDLKNHAAGLLAQMK
jgi:hypothetical protein